MCKEYAKKLLLVLKSLKILYVANHVRKKITVLSFPATAIRDIRLPRAALQSHAEDYCMSNDTIDTFPNSELNQFLCFIAKFKHYVSTTT